MKSWSDCQETNAVEQLIVDDEVKDEEEIRPGDHPKSK